jgi:uncharacterized protein (TIGR01244 family)
MVWTLLRRKQMPPLLRLVVLGLVALLPPAAALAGVPPSVDPALIPNYHPLSAEVAAAGQPAPAAIAQLKALGFRTVVNLRTESEGPAEERAAVEAQGLRYVNVPITAESFSAADADAVQKVLDDASAAPVLLHCASSNRVGGVWAVIQARKGRTLEEAEAAGQAAGLHSAPMMDAVRRVLAAPAPKPAKP